MKYNYRPLAALLCGLSIAGAAQAGATNAVAYAAVSGPTITFSELAEGPIEGLLTSGGVQFGERFVGQELAVTPAPGSFNNPSAQDRFDNLAFGSPLAGLSLLAGATGANLGVYNYGDAHGAALFGVGPQASYAEGLGAISARFAAPVSALGFQLRDIDYGVVTLSLYRLDGSLIENVTVSGVTDYEAPPVFVAFARTGGVADIAGFTLTNQDSYYGVSIDNLVLATAPVPEPASALLMLPGLLALGVVARRRSNKTQ